MPTTFANSINSNPIYADRAEKDASGNVITTTYATKAEIPSDELPAKSASDAGKVLTVNSAGTGVYWNAKPSEKALVAGTNITITEGSDSVTIAAAGGGAEIFMLHWSSEVNGHASDAYAAYSAAYAAGKLCFVEYSGEFMPLTNKTDKNPSAYSDGVFKFELAFGSTYKYIYTVEIRESYTSGNITATASSNQIRELPSNTASDANKVLTVSMTPGAGTYSPKWLAPATELPSKDASDAGKALVVNSAGTGVEWASVGGGSSYTFGVPLYEDNGSVELKIGTAGLVVAPDPDTGDEVLTVAIDENTIVSNDGFLEVANPLPAATASDAGKALVVNSAGTGVEWASVGGGTTYTAGNCISLASDTVAWTTSAGITDIVSTAALPSDAVATVLYLIPEA